MTIHAYPGSDVVDPPGLLYAPPGYPDYAGYTEITIPNTPLSDADRDFFNLSTSTDYLFHLDDYVYFNSIRFRGGRNVVCIGGQITLYYESDPVLNPDGKLRQGLQLWPMPGTQRMHIEGVVIRPNPADSDHSLRTGISIQGDATNKPDSSCIITLENLRIGPTGIRTIHTDSDYHSDTIHMAQSGVGADNYDGLVRIYKVTGTQEYVGLQTGANRGGRYDVSQMNERPIDIHPGYSSHFHLYQEYREMRVDLSEFYLDRTGTDYTFGNSVYPQEAPDGRNLQGQPEDAPSFGVDAEGRTYAEWPVSANIGGRAYDGLPARGDFVPDGAVGIGYVSPGYQ